MSSNRIILTGHEFTEKIDKETDKVLCMECGGKGFYLLIQFGNTKGELISCDCEQGFKYRKKELDCHGEKTKSSKCSC